MTPSSNWTSIRRLALALVVVGLLLTLSSPVPTQGADAPQEQEPIAWFGAVEPHDAPAYAGELGVGWGRARFHWAYIQPDDPDQWIEAELSSAELDRERAEGREVVGLLIGVPEWAMEEDGLPQGLYLPADDPDNLWAVFVREAVSRYAGRIDHWIIWNEPDIWDVSHPAYSWPGSIEDYVQLLRVSYLVAKDANPSAAIHLAAVSHWWDVDNDRELYFPRLLDAIIAQPDAAEHDYFYDVASMHLYFSPASVYEVLREYEGYQSERGLNKPFWLVETNAAPSQDPARPVIDPAFRVSLLEQAAYQPQVLALALAADAERVGIYKMIDTEGDIAANPEPFGLIRADGSPRPAFLTAKVAASLLDGAQRITWNEQGLVAQVVVERPGEVIRILWSRVPEPQIATIPALAVSATLVDMWGNSAPLEPVGGIYRVGTYAGECQQTTGDFCMIGGPPIYIVEQATLSGDLPAVQAVEHMPPLSSQGERASTGVGRWIGIAIVIIVLMAFELLIRRQFMARHASTGENEEG